MAHYRSRQEIVADRSSFGVKTRHRALARHFDLCEGEYVVAELHHGEVDQLPPQGDRAGNIERCQAVEVLAVVDVQLVLIEIRSLQREMAKGFSVLVLVRLTAELFATATLVQDLQHEVAKCEREGLVIGAV